MKKRKKIAIYSIICTVVTVVVWTVGWHFCKPISREEMEFYEFIAYSEYYNGLPKNIENIGDDIVIKITSTEIKVFSENLRSGEVVAKYDGNKIKIERHYQIGLAIISIFSLWLMVMVALVTAFIVNKSIFGAQYQIVFEKENHNN